MSHLDKLNVSNRVLPKSQPRRKTDSVEHRRNKLIANIEEQIELANLLLQNKTPQLSRKRGHNVITVRPRLWWKTTPEGEVFTEIRHNKIAVNIQGRGTLIDAGSLKKLPTIYRTVIRAIRAGELDQTLEQMANKTS